MRGKIFRDLLAGATVEELALKYRVDKSDIRDVRSEAESITRVYAPRGWVMDAVPTVRDEQGWYASAQTRVLKGIRNRQMWPARPKIVKRKQGSDEPLIKLSAEQWTIVFGAGAGWLVIVAAGEEQLQLLGVIAGGTIGFLIHKVWERIAFLEKQIDELQKHIPKEEE